MVKMDMVKASERRDKSPDIGSFVRDRESMAKMEAQKVKVLALLKAMRDEINMPFMKGIKMREFADIFVERYNFFYRQCSDLFPGSDFSTVFSKFDKGSTSLEKIRLEITLLIAFVQNDIMDIIEQSERLKQKNKWLQDRCREFEIQIAGIQAIK